MNDQGRIVLGVSGVDADGFTTVHQEWVGITEGSKAYQDCLACLDSLGITGIALHFEDFERESHAYADAHHSRAPYEH